jgi:hypothetical protein
MLDMGGLIYIIEAFIRVQPLFWTSSPSRPSPCTLLVLIRRVRIRTGHVVLLATLWRRSANVRLRTKVHAGDEVCEEDYNMVTFFASSLNRA